MGRYIRFGIREHGMVAICNGIAAHGGLIPYCATFLNFAGYAVGAMRVTALSRFRVIVATGSEVQYAIEAKAAMGDVQVSVVSMPCQELFDEQPKEYQLSVFPEGVPVLSVEAMGVRGWEKYAHLSVGMTGFGASGPIDALYSKFGFTTENIVTQAKGLLAFYDGKPAPSLVNGPVNTFKVIGHH